MAPIKPKKRAIYFSFFSLLFVTVVPFIIMYSLGYRFTNDYAIAERGGIYVYVPESGAEIFIDNELQKTTGTFQHELFLQNLKPGQYSVRVESKNFEIWTKIILITEKEVTPIFPFLVPKDLGLREVVVATSTKDIVGATVSTSTYLQITATEQKEISSLFKAPVLVPAKPIKPATTTPEFFAITKKNMKVWSDGNKVFAKWIGDEARTPEYFCDKETCENILQIFDAKTSIRHIDFYPTRDDAIIVSYGDSVVALETDTRETQNIYALYKNKKPDFRIGDNKVYVKDGDFVGQLSEI